MQCLIFTSGFDEKPMEEEINGFLDEFKPKVVFVTQSESQSTDGFGRTITIWYETETE